MDNTLKGELKESRDLWLSHVIPVKWNSQEQAGWLSGSALYSSSDVPDSNMAQTGYVACSIIGFFVPSRRRLLPPIYVSIHHSQSFYHRSSSVCTMQFKQLLQRREITKYDTINSKLLRNCQWCLNHNHIKWMIVYVVERLSNCGTSSVSERHKLKWFR
jgi:hypothetical protein